MEHEKLFTSSKWDILRLLSEKEFSPLELSDVAQTSVANISQQLRLLELAGLVKSRRVSNRNKGQPRILYSLAGNYSYLIATASDFVDKKFLKLTTYNKAILRIWFLDDPKTRYFLEKAFWSIEEELNKVDELYFDADSKNPVRFLIRSEHKNLGQKFPSRKIRNDLGEEVDLEIIQTTDSVNLDDFPGKWSLLHDRNSEGSDK